METDILGADESLFINPGILEQDYLPRLLAYRENEHSYLADCIKPLFQGRNGTNLLVSGSPGIGKTACAKFILRKLREETEMVSVYVNCWKRDSSFKIVNNIAEQLDIRIPDKKGMDELFDIVLKKLNKESGAVFVFDEFDKVQDYSFLYRVLEDISLKTIFILTNNTEFVASLDKRLMSRLSLERLEFKAYSFEETRGILNDRQKEAFVPNVWVYEALEKVIKKTFELKDLRAGLSIMKKAGEIAENRASRKIEERDADEAIGKINDIYGKGSLKDF